MKKRTEVVEFIAKQMSDEETKLPKSDPDYYSQCWHYGYVELRELLDFIYGGAPANESEQLNKDASSDP